MRWIGICERVFDTMCRHITRRKIDPEKTLASRQIAQAWVAEARAEIELLAGAGAAGRVDHGLGLPFACPSTSRRATETLWTSSGPS